LTLSEIIEGRAAHGGIIRPNIPMPRAPTGRRRFISSPNKSRQGCTLEAPSDFPLPVRVDALVAAVNAALEG
jgi:hypothetical protein